MLGLTYEPKRGYIGLEYCGRTVSIKILPVGIHMGQLQSVLSLPETEAKVDELIKQYHDQGRIMLLGVEDKETALGWCYEDADPDFGSCQAKELLDHLESVLLANEPVTVKSGQNIVEVLDGQEDTMSVSTSQVTARQKTLDTYMKRCSNIDDSECQSKFKFPRH